MYMMSLEPSNSGEAPASSPMVHWLTIQADQEWTQVALVDGHGPCSLVETI